MIIAAFVFACTIIEDTDIIEDTGPMTPLLIGCPFCVWNGVSWEADMTQADWTLVAGEADGPLQISGLSGAEWRAPMNWLVAGDAITAVSLVEVDTQGRSWVMGFHRSPRLVPEGTQGSTDWVWGVTSAVERAVDVDPDVPGDQPLITEDGVSYTMSVWLGNAMAITPVAVDALSVSFTALP